MKLIKVGFLLLACGFFTSAAFADDDTDGNGQIANNVVNTIQTLPNLAPDDVMPTVVDDVAVPVLVNQGPAAIISL